MKIIVFYIISLYIPTLFSQSYYNLNEYNAVSKESLQHFFSDEFMDDKYNWTADQISESHKLKDGFLFLTSSLSTPLETSIPIDFDEMNDFQIETSIQVIQGDANAFSGIFWGIQIFSETYKFGFSPNGSHTIFKDNSTSIEKYLDWTHSGLINPKSTNKLTIRKMDNEYYFFINEKFVHSFSYFPLPGFDIGFRVAAKSTIKIDYLTVSYIN